MVGLGTIVKNVPYKKWIMVMVDIVTLDEKLRYSIVIVEDVYEKVLERHRW